MAFLSSLALSLLFLPGIAQSIKPDSLFAQQNTSDIIQPKHLGNHPLGIYMMRLESDFRTHPLHKKGFSIQWSSGNVWEPPVIGILPIAENDRKFFNELEWHRREGYYTTNPVPSDSIMLSSDAIIKGLNISYYLPVSKNQELRFDLRSYLFTKGAFPFSTLTSDDAIEWFHSHIAGGEDPFARKIYGYNHLEMEYTDPSGKKLTKPANNILIPGIEIHYSYFVPSNFLKQRHLHLQVSAHLGINTTKYNPSSDIGVSLLLAKFFTLNQSSKLKISAGSGILIPTWIKWGDAIELTNNNLMINFDGQILFEKTPTKNTRWAFYLNYHLQSPYRKQTETNYLVMIGDRYVSQWHYAISHLYKTLSAWHLGVSMSKKNYTLSYYISEDLNVNNAPDIQTGIQLSFPLN